MLLTLQYYVVSNTALAVVANKLKMLPKRLLQIFEAPVKYFLRPQGLYPSSKSSDKKRLQGSL